MEKYVEVGKKRGDIEKVNTWYQQCRCCVSQGSKQNNRYALQTYRQSHSQASCAIAVRVANTGPVRLSRKVYGINF